MTTPAQTKATIAALKQKAKTGWRLYFIWNEMYNDLMGSRGTFVQENKELRKKIEENEDIDITFLKKQFIEMYDTLKKEGECPICYGALAKENIHVANCGHMLCKGCLKLIYDAAPPSTLPKCGMCQKNFPRKFPYAEGDYTQHN